MSLLQNWDSIIAVAIVIILDAAAVAKVVLNLIARVKTAAQEDDKADQTEILRSIIFSLVTDAERDLGSGTGKLKYSKVAAWVYEKIPDDMKNLFSAMDIQEMIEDVLPDAQAYWEANAKAKEYIESGDTVLTATAEIGTIQTGASVEEIVRAVSDRISSAIIEAATGATEAQSAENGKLPTDAD